MEEGRGGWTGSGSGCGRGGVSVSTSDSGREGESEWTCQAVVDNSLQCVGRGVRALWDGVRRVNRPWQGMGWSTVSPPLLRVSVTRRSREASNVTPSSQLSPARVV